MQPNLMMGCRVRFGQGQGPLAQIKLFTIPDRPGCLSSKLWYSGLFISSIENSLWEAAYLSHKDLANTGYNGIIIFIRSGTVVDHLVAHFSFPRNLQPGEVLV
jgi:hypothetical protein